MSAPGLAHWVPLRQLRSTVAEVFGEAEADIGVITVLAAIDVGQMPVRWSSNLAAWRFAERETGRQLASASGAQTHGLLSQMRGPAWPSFRFDPVEGIALATLPDDPAEATEAAEAGQRGPLPLGPVDVPWHLAAALLDKAGQTQRGAE